MGKSQEKNTITFKNLHFITFAEGEEFTKLAKWNIKKLSKVYPKSKTRIFDSRDLNSKILEFAKYNPRGFGYWIWKPFIISNYISSLEDNSIVVYFDSRAAFFGNSIKWLDELILSRQRQDFIVYRGNHMLEIEWTKMDTLEYLALDENTSVLYSGQIYATLICMNICTHSKKIINDWLKLSLENPLLINDEIKSSNFQDFQEHRHDQSLLSLLLKKSYALDNDSSKLKYLNRATISGRDSIILHYFTHPRRRYASLKNYLKRTVPFQIQMKIRAILKKLRLNSYYPQNNEQQ
jgi:hypothetical protein